MLAAHNIVRYFLRDISAPPHGMIPPLDTYRTVRCPILQRIVRSLCDTPLKQKRKQAARSVAILPLKASHDVKSIAAGRLRIRSSFWTRKLVVEKHRGHSVFLCATSRLALLTASLSKERAMSLSYLRGFWGDRGPWKP